MAQQLSARGYVTMNISYRLSGEALSCSHLRLQISRQMGPSECANLPDRPRPYRIGGRVCRGHLSGLLGTSGHSAGLNHGGNHLGFRSEIQACVVMAGTMDLTTEDSKRSAAHDPRRRTATFVGGTWEEAKSTFIAASPITHVSTNSLPCFSWMANSTALVNVIQK